MAVSELGSAAAGREPRRWLLLRCRPWQDAHAARAVACQAAGSARRVVIAAPNSLVFNWAREIERVLPDFRFRNHRGAGQGGAAGREAGELISEPDTPAQRAAKWQRFQAGLYDLVIVTYSALPRTQLDLPSILQIVRSVPAVQRELVLKVRETERRIESLEKRAKAGKLDEEQEAELSVFAKQLRGMAGTERKEAILEEREEGFAAKWAVPPVGQGRSRHLLGEAGHRLSRV